MDQRISLVTLAVDDLDRSRAFFEQGLGWRRSSASNADISFYQTGSSALAIFPRVALAADATVPMEGRGVTIACNGRSEADVDAMFAEAVAAGAEAVKPPHKTFWGGYSSYVAIPGSGHMLEIAHNPFFPMDEEGGIHLP